MNEVINISKYYVSTAIRVCFNPIFTKLTVALFAVAVTCLPTGEDPVNNLETLEQDLKPDNVEQVPVELRRDKRVTCSIGEWVCVGHCNSMGKKSGYCSRGVCYCKN
uniref:Invertebrate defensins family profile domain-containing protein n=1 Tax=Glossina brevipalpis TaxID=37001 RepID=A0A1A9VZV1_9MUSC